MGSKPGAQCPHAGDDPDVDTTGPELVNAISDDKLRQSA